MHFFRVMEVPFDCRTICHAFDNRFCRDVSIRTKERAPLRRTIREQFGCAFHDHDSKHSSGWCIRRQKRFVMSTYSLSYRTKRLPVYPFEWPLRWDSGIFDFPFFSADDLCCRGWSSQEGQKEPLPQSADDHGNRGDCTLRKWSFGINAMCHHQDSLVKPILKPRDAPFHNL